MTAIIFGAAGQDGIYLNELLQKEGYTVINVSRSVGYMHIDIANYTQVSHLIKRYLPHYIFHLAANSTTAHEALFENHATIVIGTLNILESVKNFSSQSKVFISGSALQFKNDGRPIKETDPFEARDAYSMNRIQSVYAARYYRNMGIKVYIGYFFNHDSPLRTERHMSKKISAAAQRIDLGSDEKIEIGDLNAIKEYSFAGDIVKGVWALVNQDNIMEANIASGKGYSIKEWLQQCFLIINRNWEDYVILKNDFLSEYTQLVSDPSLIFTLGWNPEVSFEQLAFMMMNSK